MANSFFVNENQFKDWISAAERVRDEYGVDEGHTFMAEKRTGVKHKL